jgi:hypothetical protein
MTVTDHPRDFAWTSGMYLLYTECNNASILNTISAHFALRLYLHMTNTMLWSSIDGIAICPKLKIGGVSTRKGKKIITKR